MQPPFHFSKTPAGRRLVSPSFFISSLLIGLLALSGCDGNGGSGNGPAPTGTASGKLTVPPDNTVEVEPNDDIPQAQPVSNTMSLSGSATESDLGFSLSIPNNPQPIIITVSDLYRVETTAPIRVTMSIAAENTEANDLDLFLMDADGTLPTDPDELPNRISAGLVSTEIVESTGAGTFFIGVNVFQGQSAYVLDITPIGGLSSNGLEPIPAGAEFVPGEVFVKLKKDASGARRKSSGFAARHGLTPKRSLPGEVELMQVVPPSPPLQKGEHSKVKPVNGKANELKALMIDTIRRLRRDPDVVYAEPNFIRRPFATPNDTHFPKQWHYELINLPQAWDVTVGSNSITVAVLDTGVLVDHPDLDERLIPGFDFVDNDADADDEGDDPRGISSSFHGTHVAGTIGAETNTTGVGVAGVTWQTQILPLRVLGAGGGTDDDIAEAIRYAAGIEDPQQPRPKRAHIINMSLGGEGFSQTMQDAITDARDADVIVVAAAGNENTSALTSPAGLDGVISVSAVDLNARKAPYSNFGSKVDVAAPGGNTSADLNGDDFADGVLSTLGDDDGDFFFRFYQGTSMAAPHVAGVLALMLAVNPNLIPADIDQLLAGNHPNTTQRITRDLGATGRDDLYGHGLIDAALAVQAASAVQGGGTPPTTPILSLSTTSLDFNNYINTLQINITNAGIGTLNITEITTVTSDGGSWLTVTPTSGTAPLTVNAAVDRTGLADGNYTATITINTDAGQATVTVEMTVGGETLGNVGTVFVLVVDEAFETVSETATSRAQNYAFTLPETPAGTYTIVAGTDRDDDGAICDLEDACGSFPEPVTVTPGEDRPGIEILVGDLVSPQRAKGTLGGTQGKKFRRLQ